MPVQSYLRVLETLVDHHVDFIVIGLVSAVLNGAPVNTFDVDVVHSRSPENVDRLVGALEEMDAYYRLQPQRKFRPNSSHLLSPGHQLLMTKFGPADFLGTVSGNRGYEDLFPHTLEVDVKLNLRVRVLNLEMLITLKEEAGRDKDLAVLPVLRRTLEESRKRYEGP